MTGPELFQGITQLLTSLAAVGAVVVSVRNGKKIDVVHKTTNSLSERNEALAKDVGIALGKAQEKDNPGK